MTVEQVGVGPADLDVIVIEIHDVFSLRNSRVMMNWDYMGMVRGCA